MKGNGNGLRKPHRLVSAAAGAIGIALLVLAIPGNILPAFSTAGVPAYDHIFFVIDENRARTQVIGPAPYLTGLATANAQSATYFAVTHPSVNNYLALESGQTYTTITDSCKITLTSCSTNAAALADEVEASGRSWKGYLEAMPSPCYGPHDSGAYTERHNPFPYFNQIRTNATRCARYVPYTQLASDLRAAATTPNYVWITPNLQNDMHDGSVGQGDAWAAANFPAIFASPAWTTQRSLLMFTLDEDDGSARNNVAFFVVSSDGSTKKSFTSTVHATAYSALRTIEASWGLSAMVAAGDGAAAPMADLFTGTSSVRAPSPRPTQPAQPPAARHVTPSLPAAISPSPSPSPKEVALLPSPERATPGAAVSAPSRRAGFPIVPLLLGGLAFGAIGAGATIWLRRARM